MKRSWIKRKSPFQKLWKNLSGSRGESTDNLPNEHCQGNPTASHVECPPTEKQSPKISFKRSFKKGPKTKQWDRIRAELKIRFEIVGITRCEICGSDLSLGFSHRKRRRNCDEDELYRAILCCQTCHKDIDSVNLIINTRNEQP